MMKYRKKFSLRMRINIIFAGFMVFLIAALYSVSNYSVGLFKEYFIDSNMNTLDTVVDGWEEKLDTIGWRLMDISYHERESLKVLRTVQNTGDLDYIISSGDMRRRLADDLNYSVDMSACFVYIKQHDDLIIGSRSAGDRYTSYDELIKSHCTDLGVWTLMHHGEEYSLIKAIDIGFDMYIGAILDVEDVADSIIKALQREDYARIQAMSNDGRILFETGENIDDRNTLQIQRKLSYSGVTFVVYLQEENILRHIPFYNYAALIYVSVIALLLLIIYHVILYRSISRPINALLQSLNKVENGITDAHIAEVNSSEFNYLIHAYNDMLDKIYDLKIDVLDRDMKVKLAQLRQLQAQINPHFFMNSLNLVLSLTSLHNYEMVSNLIYLLCDYFRFTMHNTSVTTDIRDELQRVKTYLEIHKIRYPKNLDYTFIVSPQVENIKIPPLIIQPLVENSIAHGFPNSKDTTFLITVEIEKSNDFLFICVHDNGKGFTPEKLEYIRNAILKKDHALQDDSKHIGIQNVHLRLEMFFGEDIEMAFDNTPDGGAMVRIKVPVTAI